MGGWGNTFSRGPNTCHTGWFVRQIQPSKRALLFIIDFHGVGNWSSIWARQESFLQRSYPARLSAWRISPTFVLPGDIPLAEQNIWELVSNSYSLAVCLQWQNVLGLVLLFSGFLLCLPWFVCNVEDWTQNFLDANKNSLIDLHPQL